MARRFKNPFPGFPFDGGAFALSQHEIEENWKAFEAAQPASATAVPLLTEEQMDAQIETRLKEMQRIPCYRCDHPPARPDAECPCCQHEHTPDADARFDGKTLDEWRKEKKR